MESLPLKELDFGLQKRTGPSSGVVASIVLVSPGLDCPGVNLAEICATCLRCHLLAWSFRIIQPLFKNQNCGCFKNHKKSKLCHKVIIFISLESSCVTL